MKINTRVNGESVVLVVDAGETAAQSLRSQLNLTGLKVVCEGGVCGACTILKDGNNVTSCLLPATSLEGSTIETVEGLNDPISRRVQEAMAREDALQCGYCSPGYVIGITHFVRQWRATREKELPSREEIASALAGHLCRCGSYAAIYQAVQRACSEQEWATPPRSGQRIGASEKLTGKAAYSTDIIAGQLLHAVVIRAVEAPGQLVRLDLAPVKAQPDIVETIPLVEVGTAIRWVGQPIAAIAGETLNAALSAASVAQVEIKTSTAVVSISQASAPGANKVYGKFWQAWRAPSATPWPALPALWLGNRHLQMPLSWGGLLAKWRINRARKQASPLLYEASFTTSSQVHCSFEPHASVALWQDNCLQVWASTQTVDALRHELASKFNLGIDQVVVRAKYIGGAFGSKQGLDTETTASVRLAMETGRPVKLVPSRFEELSATGSRAATETDVAMLARHDGSIAAASFVSRSNGGLAKNSSVAALSLLMYGHSPRYARDTDIVTNIQPGTEMRGPCGPPAAWALESSMDGMAHRLGLDPLTLRRKLDGNKRRQVLYSWLADSSLWARRPTEVNQEGRYRRGVGMASGNWFYFVDPDSEVTVRITHGRLQVETSSQDIGQGSATVLALTVAEVFNVSGQDVDVKLGRSLSRHGPSSTGSRTTASLGPTARSAAQLLRQKINGNISSEHEGISATATRGGDRGIRAMPITVNHLQIGRGFTGSVHAAEVIVDTKTGHVQVVDVLCGIAAGKIYAPQQARLQVEGGVIQGLGYALYEEVRHDPHSGISLTGNMQDYRIPQLGDTPPIDVYFYEDGWPRVPGGGVGLSEISTLGMSPAIGNAVFNAAGWQPRQLPIRPDRILEAFDEDRVPRIS